MSGDGLPGSVVDKRLSKTYEGGARNLKPSSHVEGHMAGLMRESGIDRATVYINNPKGPCRRCKQELENMLEDGHELTVIYKDKKGNFITKIFTGIKDLK